MNNYNKLNTKIYNKYKFYIDLYLIKRININFSKFSYILFFKKNFNFILKFIEKMKKYILNQRFIAVFVLRKI